MDQMNLPYDITCGYCDCSEFGNLSRSPERVASKYEIEYYLQDALITVADGEVFHIYKDHIKIGRPGQHCYSELPFTTMYLKFSVDGYISQELEKIPTYFQCQHSERILFLLNQIALNSDGDIINYSRILELLHIIIADSSCNVPQRPEDLEIIAKAKAYIGNKFSERITLSDIAAHVNLSSSYFHSLFTSICGMTPHKYILETRINHAKRMLWNTNTSISYIAENCGFGCQQYFNKVFKDETSFTPGEYRRNNQMNYLD